MQASTLSCHCLFLLLWLEKIPGGRRIHPLLQVMPFTHSMGSQTGAMVALKTTSNKDAGMILSK